MKDLAILDADWAERGTSCLRRGTAARIIAPGEDYFWRAMNSQLMGCTNRPGSCGCLHAEPKAIVAMLKDGPWHRNFIMLTTLAPCTACANLIVATGCFSEVHYLRAYEDTRGPQILAANGVWCSKL